MNKISLVMVLLVLSACTRPDAARMTLERQSFSDVQITGYAWFACGRDDSFSTAFKAVSPSGERVEGAVCSGLLKGNTIRLD